MAPFEHRVPHDDHLHTNLVAALVSRPPRLESPGRYRTDLKASLKVMNFDNGSLANEAMRRY